MESKDRLDKVGGAPEFLVGEAVCRRPAQAASGVGAKAVKFFKRRERIKTFECVKADKRRQEWQGQGRRQRESDIEADRCNGDGPSGPSSNQRLQRLRRRYDWDRTKR